jgi:hypothetical protein
LFSPPFTPQFFPVSFAGFYFPPVFIKQPGNNHNAAVHQDTHNSRERELCGRDGSSVSSGE